MTVFEYDGKLLIVDCGVLFPDVEQPGVDLILPDFAPILDRLDDVQAIVLTHGHEDHIGAVPYLLAHKPDIPLVGSQFTLALVEAKLAERRIEPYTLTVREGQRERLGPFECEFFAVNHSIPDALAVAIRTAAGTGAAHRRLQDGPAAAGRPDHRPRRVRAARRRGRRPAAVGLHQRGDPRLRHPGAGDRARARRDLRQGARAGSSWRRSPRTCTACSRCSTPAHEHGRKVALIGRSMVRNMGIARDLGLLRIPAGLVVGIDEATTLPPDQIVLMSTGSQGEPMSALGRMATGDHRHITDRARRHRGAGRSLVPGNETAVYRVINQLSRAGAIVVHKDVAKVHVSGHAPAGELLYLLNVVRPSNLMPVHGEWRHLRAHARLGIEAGVPPTGWCSARTATSSTWSTARRRLVGHVKSRYVYVDGLAVGDVGESLLTERRILGDGGFIAATVVIDSVTGKVVAGADGVGEGLLRGPGGVQRGDSAGHRGAEPGRRRRHHRPAPAAADRPAHGGRWVNDTYRRRPMIVPTVVEV